MAGALSVLAGLALLASGVCLAIFFSTGSDAWGRLNDATVAAWAVLMIPAALEVSARYGSSSGIVAAVTVLAVAGEIVIGATSGLTAVGKLDWRRSATIGAGGFVAFAAWVGAVSAMTFRWGGLPEALAWFGVVALVLAVAAVLLALRFVRPERPDESWRPPGSTTTVWVLAFLCIPAWCIWLGISL